MKKLILSILLILTLTTTLISAGLCRGDDGYYHDCDDSRYFEDYDDEYYYNGRYYPSRAYYYRDYYKPRYSNKFENYYKDVEEYSRNIEYKYKNRYGSQTLKYTIDEKTEIESDYGIPIYRFSPYKNRYHEDDEDEKEIINFIPWHYSEYKKYY